MLTRKNYLALLEGRLTPRRLHHSLCVEEAAARLAALHGVNPAQAALAGLLHDICRDAPTHWQREYLRRHGIRLDAAWLAHPQIWHGPCGSLFLRRELGLKDRGVLRAIYYHTVCRRGMSPLEKVLCLADATGADRTYGGVERLRGLARQDLDTALLHCLKGSVARVAAAGRPLVRETWEAYNEYALQTSEQKNGETI